MGKRSFDGTKYFLRFIGKFLILGLKPIDTQHLQSFTQLSSTSYFTGNPPSLFQKIPVDLGMLSRDSTNNRSPFLHCSCKEIVTIPDFLLEIQNFTYNRYLYGFVNMMTADYTFVRVAVQRLRMTSHFCQWSTRWIASST